jgi:hypothetical protein
MAMTQQLLTPILEQELTVAKALKRAAVSAHTSATMDFGVSEMILLSIVLPLTSYIVKEIGLPWLSEAQRYSELWRLKVDDWIAQQYHQNGLDQQQAQLASEELRKELETTQDREAWERVLKLLE